MDRVFVVYDMSVRWGREDFNFFGGKILQFLGHEDLPPTDVYVKHPINPTHYKYKFVCVDGMKRLQCILNARIQRKGRINARWTAQGEPVQTCLAISWDTSRSVGGVENSE